MILAGRGAYSAIQCHVQMGSAAVPPGISKGDCEGECRGGRPARPGRGARLWVGLCWVAQRSMGSVRLPPKGTRKQLRVRRWAQSLRGVLGGRSDSSQAGWDEPPQRI